MKLKILVIDKINFVKPLTNVDIFEHCFNGRDIVPETEFDRKENILFAHGIRTLEFVKD